MLINTYFSKIRTKLKNLESDTKKALLIYAILPLIGYPFLQFPIQVGYNAFTPRITPEKAMAVIEKEKRKNGFNENIELIIDEKCFEPNARYKDGKNVITTNKALLKEFVIVHETYHIIKGHIKKGNSFEERLLRIYVDEPQTMLYQMGIIDK